MSTSSRKRGRSRKKKGKKKWRSLDQSGAQKVARTMAYEEADEFILDTAGDESLGLTKTDR